MFIALDYNHETHHLYVLRLTSLVLQTQYPIHRSTHTNYFNFQTNSTISYFHVPLIMPPLQQSKVLLLYFSYNSYQSYLDTTIKQVMFSAHNFSCSKSAQVYNIHSILSLSQLLSSYIIFLPLTIQNILKSILPIPFRTTIEPNPNAYHHSHVVKDLLSWRC